MLGAQSALQAPAPLDFDREVRPILSENCFKCHGPDASQRKADLRLDTKEGAFGPAGEGRAIVPGRPEESELYRRITALDPDDVMPPPESGKKLGAEQIALLRRWIAEGAEWRGHWAFIAPRRPAVPRVRRAPWLRNAVDFFILARLEREGVAPSPEAERATLLRRASLDLTGLPPTPEEIDALLADPSPDAYEKAVDRLLASPRFGEHMTWPWLEAARYADTNGYMGDGVRTMWPWRDWVVDAFNRNLPFDRFTLEQIAGDLLPEPTVEQRVATGFNRNHMLNNEGGRIPEENRAEYVMDRVETTSTVWLGLTTGCARCHDHKYDPVSQKEYYGLFAYFNNITETGEVETGPSAQPVLVMSTPEEEAQIAALQETMEDLQGKLQAVETARLAANAGWEAEIAAKTEGVPENIAAILQVPVAERAEEQISELREFYLSGDQECQNLRKEVEQAQEAHQAAMDAVVKVMIMEERPERRETFLLKRGAYDRHGERVEAGVPASLSPLPPGASPDRLALARWLVDPGHPLTARVTVSRFWQQVFGTGLVRTTENFGIQGERPSHPDLLDWLSTEFVRTGWDVKALLRLIVTSATYRQSSLVTPELLEKDPENRLLARGPRYRLASAALRDQALAASGLLFERLGGPPVNPYQPASYLEERMNNHVYEQAAGEGLYRRSLYTFWRRTVGPPNLFDASARQVCCVRQARTNTPLQALTLLNDVTYLEAARVLGERMMREGGTTPGERIAWAFRRVAARVPGTRELAVLEECHAVLRERYAADAEAAKSFVSAGLAPRDETLDVTELAACAGVAGVIMNLDEVLTKE
jgi:hypothetical protein